VACAVSHRNKRENVVVFGLRDLSLSFCKGDFCHLPSENAGQFERESRTHSNFRTHMCLRGGRSKWLAKFK